MNFNIKSDTVVWIHMDCYRMDGASQFTPNGSNKGDQYLTKYMRKVPMLAQLVRAAGDHSTTLVFSKTNLCFTRGLPRYITIKGSRGIDRLGCRLGVCLMSMQPNDLSL